MKSAKKMVHKVANKKNDGFTNIGALMSSNIVTVTPETTIYKAAKVLKEHKIGALMVVKRGKLCGILSERDFVTKIAVYRKDMWNTAVESVMTSKLFTAMSTEALSSIFEKMQNRHIRHIPIVNTRNQPVGIVSMRDVMYKMEEHLQNLLKQKTHEVRVDNLTGLYNVKFFDDYLDTEIARTSRRGTRFTLLLIDLDYFKRFNDTYGHSKGNVLLKAFAGLINPHGRRLGKFSIRRSDVAVRLGGDEFALILSDTNKAGALVCANRLKELAPTLTKKIVKTKSFAPVTISIGVAEYPTHAKSRDNLVEKADQALYQAKRLGRNQVCVHGE